MIYILPFSTAKQNITAQKTKAEVYNYTPIGNPNIVRHLCDREVKKQTKKIGLYL